MRQNSSEATACNEGFPFAVYFVQQNSFFNPCNELIKLQKQAIYTQNIL